MRILVSGSTKTVRELASRYSDHLGHLLTPANRNRGSVWGTGLPVGVDNGAFSGFDPVSFRLMLGRLADAKCRPLWVCCPDRVADAQETLRLFEEWATEIKALGFPVAFIGQDGQEELPAPWDHFRCLFLGGSTRWKLSKAAADLAREAKRRDKLVHMGRVNTLRRLRYARDLGCDSIDGKSFSAWSNQFLGWAIRFLRREAQQRTLY